MEGTGQEEELRLRCEGGGRDMSLVMKAIVSPACAEMWCVT